MENEIIQTPPKNNFRIFAVILILAAIVGFIKFNDNKSYKTKQVPPKSDLTKINVAYPALGTVYTGQIGTILQKSEILKNNKLDAKVTAYGTGKEMKVAMVSNQADVMLCSESVYLVLVGQGFDAYAIDSLGADGKMALVVNKDSKFKEIKDLKNKKLGTIFGTSPHKPAVQWVEEAGLTPGKNIDLVNLPDAASIRAALASKQIDAALLWDPFVTDGLNKDQYRVLKDTDMDLVTVMSKDFADKHPEAVAQLNASLKDAAFYLTQNKDQVAQWYSDNSKLDKNLIMQVSPKNVNYNVTKAEDINISISPALTAKLQDTSKFLFDQKLINKLVDVPTYTKQQ